MSQILDNLYLGRQLDAKNKDFLTKSKITHVFNCAWEAQYSLSKDIQYFELKLKDQPNFPIIKYLDQAADHINKVLNEEKGVLFVHCMWGVSRSATLVIAYLMKYHNWNCLDAREFVKNKRPEISPNKSFWKTLQGYCEKLPPEILKEKHVHEVCKEEEVKKEVNEGRDSIKKIKILAMKEKKKLDNKKGGFEAKFVGIVEEGIKESEIIDKRKEDLESCEDRIEKEKGKN